MPQHPQRQSELSTAGCSYFFFPPFVATFRALDRFFLAIINLNRSKSVMLEAVSLFFNFLPHEVAQKFSIVFSSFSAFLSVLSRAARTILLLKSVRVSLRTGMRCLRTPVTDSGPSTTTFFCVQMSIIVQSFPSQGPYVINAKRPGSTNRLYKIPLAAIASVMLCGLDLILEPK